MRILIDDVSTNNKIILRDLVTFFYLAKTSRAEAKSSLRKIGASMAFAPDDHYNQDDHDGSIKIMKIRILMSMVISF